MREALPPLDRDSPALAGFDHTASLCDLVQTILLANKKPSSFPSCPRRCRAGCRWPDSVAVAGRLISGQLVFGAVSGAPKRHSRPRSVEHRQAGRRQAQARIAHTTTTHAAHAQRQIHTPTQHQQRHRHTTRVCVCSLSAAAAARVLACVLLFRLRLSSRRKLTVRPLSSHVALGAGVGLRPLVSAGLGVLLSTRLASHVSLGLGCVRSEYAAQGAGPARPVPRAQHTLLARQTHAPVPDEEHKNRSRRIGRTRAGSLHSVDGGHRFGQVGQ